MTKADYKHYNKLAEEGKIKDDLNPAFLYAGIKTDLLVQIVNKKISAIEIAKRELECRGMNYKGEFVGFSK